MVLEITSKTSEWQLLSSGLAALRKMQQLNGKAGASLGSSKEALAQCKPHMAGLGALQGGFMWLPEKS